MLGALKTHTATADHRLDMEPRRGNLSDITDGAQLSQLQGGGLDPRT
jgi:hypothetical protein